MKFFLNYFYTGAAAAFFLLLAFIDVLIREPKDSWNYWDQTWDIMSVFGKIDVVLFAALFAWTIGVVLFNGLRQGRTNR